MLHLRPEAYRRLFAYWFSGIDRSRSIIIYFHSYTHLDQRKDRGLSINIDRLRSHMLIEAKTIIETMLGVC